MELELLRKMSDTGRLNIARMRSAWGYLNNLTQPGPAVPLFENQQRIGILVKLADCPPHTCHCIFSWNGEIKSDARRSFIRIPKELWGKVMINNLLICPDEDVTLIDGDVIHFIHNGIIHAFRLHLDGAINFPPLALLEDAYDPIVDAQSQQGAFGNVRFMKPKGLCGPVTAVKTIKYPDESYISHEVSVMEMLKTLHHDNICSFDSVFYEPQIYSIHIVMPKMDGDLATLLNQTIISEREARNIVYQICDAMKSVHAMGIIHYDLKPQNILVSFVNEAILVKVADFGIAVITNEDIQGPLHNACGTIGYMAPEIVNVEQHNNLVDSWGVGVMTFQLLTNNFFPGFYNNWDLKFDSVVELTRSTRTRLAIEFTTNLLQVDWKVKRFSLTQAFEHAWLHNADPEDMFLPPVPSQHPVRPQQQQFIPRDSANINNALVLRNGSTALIHDSAYPKKSFGRCAGPSGDSKSKLDINNLQACLSNCLPLSSLHRPATSALKSGNDDWSPPVDEDTPNAMRFKFLPPESPTRFREANLGRKGVQRRTRGVREKSKPYPACVERYKASEAGQPNHVYKYDL
ncbi:Calcium/calmodulin-dependent protein kinase type 1 [Psilocybe cubensis]|uniref:Protein kinase domain-containing protein n=2 Tax=Psilocybe cubensis TaxID=181762 RepID=A0A8H8CM81_PSICU|nr:Calcium/calmodulin-dependent protein kinase type 1 [Psilocybe cubensis]KAH9481756.1 Calcium/calmodulin-dependent protein kinase type 1 [Psilocybe cubensis]